MTQRSAQHSTFTVERIIALPLERVFDAWAKPELKERWFAGPSDKWKLITREQDFRVGGREFLKGSWEDGPTSTFEARYQNIIPNERIIYTYDMYLNEQWISVSLATIEFKAETTGTKLIVTEQGAFLDGCDDAGSRERGTAMLMDVMIATLGA